jgi:hypothetical protein
MNNLDGGPPAAKLSSSPGQGAILIIIRFLVQPLSISFIVAATQKAMHLFVSALLFQGPSFHLELNTPFFLVDEQ